MITLKQEVNPNLWHVFIDQGCRYKLHETEQFGFVILTINGHFVEGNFRSLQKAVDRVADLHIESLQS